MTALVLAAPGAWAQTTWTGELLTNPGFESGTTGWTNGGGGTLQAGPACSIYCNDPPHGGVNQAYWVTSSAAYYAYQDVNLTTWAAYIDAGTARINATGWLISNEYQASPAYDQFRMQVQFYDGASALLGGAYDTGARNVATWAQYGLTNAAIPATARRVRIWFDTWEVGNYDAGSADDFSVQVGYPSADVSLTDHVAGQEGNKFTGASSVTGAELFAFQLANNAAGSRTVTSLVLPISRVAGIAQGDFANLQIVVDANANGTIDAGETTTVGGAGVVNAGVTTITFSTAFPALSAGQTVRYILRGDVSALGVSDFVTLSLASSNLTLASGTVAGAASDVTHANGYAWRKPITIDNAILGSSCSADLTNYPVLVRIASDSALRTVANGGHVQSASGYDIVFKSSSGTSLDHEVEKYVPTTGELVAWVRVPTLALAADTTIFAYYGNPSIVSPTENPAGVWDASYAGVWHLEEAPAEGVAGHLDSTSPAQNGTPRGFADGGGGTTASTGIAAGADYFARETGTPGTFDHNRVEVPHDASLLPSGDMTVSAWVYLDAPSASARFILYKRHNNTTYAYSLYFFTGLARFQWHDASGSEPYAQGTAVPAASTWTHVTGVRRGTNLEIWVNGVREGTGAGTSGTPYSLNPNMISIGAVYEWDGSLGGRVDEVRISGVARSQCWIQTDRNNEDPGSTGVTPGLEEGAGEVILAEHPAGQEANKFGGGASVTAAELFAFELTNTATSARTVSALTLSLSNVAGIAQGDFANLQLVVDANANGTIDAGETTTVGGAGVVDAGVTTITFSTAFPALSAGQAVRYILRGDVSSLGSGDRVTISLPTGGVTLASGTVGGASPSPAVHAVVCCGLTTVADATTVTVTGTDAFEMRFNTAFGGGIDQFFDLAEDPTRANDLAGADPTSNVGQTLHSIGLRDPDTNWYDVFQDRAGKLDLLEATPTRVRVRQEAFHVQEFGTAILPGVKTTGDYSVYASGKTAVHWREKATLAAGHPYLETSVDVNLHDLGVPPPMWNTYTQGGAVNPATVCGTTPNATLCDFALAQGAASGATDFLTVISKDWTIANGYDQNVSTMGYLKDSSSERGDFFWYQQNGGTLTTAGKSWSLLTYFRPTDFLDNADTAVTSRSTDYRTPAVLTVTAPASGWFDPSENTASPNDYFNESEAAYALNLDPASGLTFQISGSAANPRYSPFFKIRQWHAPAPPATVTLNGATLTRNVNFKADVKPIARAHLAQTILWHTTLENTGTALTSPDIGTGGTGFALTPVPARYGNGYQIPGPTAGNYVNFTDVDFDKANGAVEFWYQPDYTAQVGAAGNDTSDRHLAGFRRGNGDGFLLLKSAAGNLEFTITVGTSVSTYAVAAANYSWRAGDWVHLRIEWNDSVPCAPGSCVGQQRILINGVEPVHTDPTVDYNSAGLTPINFRIGGYATSRDNGSAGTPGSTYDEVYSYGGSSTTPAPLAYGGLTSNANEYLADPAKNYPLAFAGVDTTRRGVYLYLGADSQFRGLNAVLSTAGAGVAGGALVWEYWNGTTGAWATLESGFGFTDGTSDFTRNGTVYWTSDPTNWAPYSVNGGPDLYYVRVHLANLASYSMQPVEGVIKTDILLFQHCSDIMAPTQTFAFQTPAPTLVTLADFTARGVDSSVLLAWETASELDNLGFHLYRAVSADGPWTRLNASMIPGLGSSPEGKLYRWVDGGLSNGTTYFYRLEDVDRHGGITSHGPVSATPVAGLDEPGGGGGDDGGAGGPVEPPGIPAPEPEREAHGDPTQQSLRVLERTASGATLELRTGGFYSLDQPDATSKLLVPGFFDHSEPGRPAVPTRRLWVDAVVGRGVRLESVEPSEVVSFSGLAVSLAGKPVAVAASDGTYRASSVPVSPEEAHRLARGSGDALFPALPAVVRQTAFQGERKKAYVELAPLQVDETTGEITLARRLVVRLAFAGRVAGERGRGSLGRSAPVPSPVRDGPVLARFATRSRGLHAVAFGEIPERTSPVLASDLRLSRLGRPVAFHLEPRGRPFGPGSVLYFFGEGTDAAYSTEAVYELAIGSGGVQMPGLLPSRPAPNLTAVLRRERSFEKDAVYLPALVEARDLWLWDYGIGGGQGISYPFTLDSLFLGRAPARLTLDLQGGSDTEIDPDHHVLVFVNGSLVGETRFDGMVPHSLVLDVPTSLLLEGDNTLRLENAGDTGSTASFVYLDRFSIEVPEALALVEGVLEGRAAQPGRASVEAGAGAVVLDLTGAVPRLLARSTADGRLSWNAEADHRYLAVSPEAFLKPEVRPAPTATLTSPANQADWIVIAPESLLPAAEPLVALRQSQGLTARAVSYEAVVDEFGHGEAGPHAVQGFLAFAFHQWQAPSPRYVLLLGDASYDPKGRLFGTSRPDLLPSPLTRSTYLWTAADPLYAAVNGEDSLPDIAIGRINAATLEEARAAVGKILAFETSGRTLAGKVTLVADNPDRAGDFEANQDEIATLLSSRVVEKLYLRELGPEATKAAVRSAFDAGLSLMSYAGHGSSGLWASEGILRSPDVASFVPQPAQPLVLTMTCSNGYFLSPFNNSLAERLVLADGKGAIAAFSPSGLSLDEAAQVYHRSIVAELEAGAHERLGDLLLAAQADYATTGAFPELLHIYTLLGDPGLRIR